MHSSPWRQILDQSSIIILKNTFKFPLKEKKNLLKVNIKFYYQQAKDTGHGSKKYSLKGHISEKEKKNTTETGTSTEKSGNDRAWGEELRKSILLELCEIHMYSTRSLESVQFVRNEHFRIAV